MSEHVRKPLISESANTIAIMGKRYVAPRRTLKAILTLIESDPNVKEDLVPYDEIVAEKIKQIGKGAMALKGARQRAELTQKALANRLGLDQALLSKIENGKLKISTELAAKLEKIFKINKKVFLR